MTDEERQRYLDHCDAVGSKLYSFDNHLIRYEEAPEHIKLKYRHMAHMSRVWWNAQTGNTRVTTQSVS